MITYQVIYCKRDRVWKAFGVNTKQSFKSKLKCRILKQILHYELNVRSRWKVSSIVKSKLEGNVLHFIIEIKQKDSNLRSRSVFKEVKITFSHKYFLKLRKFFSIKLRNPFIINDL